MLRGRGGSAPDFGGPVRHSVQAAGRLNTLAPGWPAVNESTFNVVIPCGVRPERKSGVSKLLFRNAASIVWALPPSAVAAFDSHAPNGVRVRSNGDSVHSPVDGLYKYCGSCRRKNTTGCHVDAAPLDAGSTAVTGINSDGSFGAAGAETWHHAPPARRSQHRANPVLTRIQPDTAKTFVRPVLVLVPFFRQRCQSSASQGAIPRCLACPLGWEVTLRQAGEQVTLTL